MSGGCWTQGAIVYVCGDGSRMEPDVRRALSDIAREHGQDGNAWLDQMIAEKRYVLDVWAGAERLETPVRWSRPRTPPGRPHARESRNRAAADVGRQGTPAALRSVSVARAGSG